jgi:4-hydroxy-tetrahydrodipicolinate synthase
LVDYAVGTINNRIPLIVGVGGNNTSDVVQAIHSMPFKGVDGILSVCPYYSKPQQEGIFQHFKVIAEACPVPVILYTVPGRTSSNINASTTLRLATECSNIIGIKEASGNFDQIFQVIKDRPEGFLVLSGDDGLTLPMIAAGADGVISVTANAFPAKVSGMVQAAMKGDFTLARNIHYDLINFTNALFKDGSPSGIKVAMEHKRLCSNYLRLPLVPANPEISRLIIQLCDQLSQ